MTTLNELDAEIRHSLAIAALNHGLDVAGVLKNFDEVAEQGAKHDTGKRPTEAILRERHTSHGDWREQAALARRLKSSLMTGNWIDLRPDEKEALEMIMLKISRILSGLPHFEDHWRDIAGYATLAADLNKTS